MTERRRTPSVSLAKQTLRFAEGSKERDTSIKILHDDEARRRYAFIVNSSPDAMAALSPDLAYEAVNAAFCEWHGVDRVRALSSVLGDRWDATIVDRVRSAAARAAREPVTVSTRVQRPNGSYAFVEASWTPYVKKDTTRAIVEIVRDVTTRVESDARRAVQERQLQLLERAATRILRTEEPRLAAMALVTELVSTLGCVAARFWKVSGSEAVPTAVAGSWVEDLSSAATEIADMLHRSEPAEDEIAGWRRVLVPVKLDGTTIGIVEAVARADNDAATRDIIAQVTTFLDPVAQRSRDRSMLVRSRDDYRALFETSQDAIVVVDADTDVVLDANPSAATLYGLPRATLVGHAMNDLRIAPDPAADANGRFETVHRGAGGAHLQIEVQSTPVEYSGRPAVLGIHRDLTPARRQHQALLESERRFREMLEGVQACAVLLDLEGRVTYANPHLAQLLGVSRTDLLGSDWSARFVVHDDPAEKPKGFRASVAAQRIVAQHDSDVRSTDGRRRTVAWNDTALHGDDGRVLGIASIGIDVTDQRRVETDLRHLAHHDPLTGLANRTLLGERLHDASSGTSASVVLYVDLDRFKLVNDSLGHSYGDRVLIEVANRLRECAPPGAMVARVGGDEFAITWTGSDNDLEAQPVAERVRGALSVPLVLEGRTVYLSASVGVAVGRREAVDLLRDADIAMYRAKRAGTRGVEVFDQAMQRDALDRLDLEAQLREAIASDRIVPALQPVVSLGPGAALSGYEALARWASAGQNISPGRFIPLAEETGLVVPLGASVLRRSCDAIARIRRLPGGAALNVAVNASAIQLVRESFVRDVEETLATFDLAPDALKIEVTESVVLEDSSQVRRSLLGLRALGVKLCLDDFGTGYSSLRYLQRFAFDFIKIDRSFVVECASPSGQAILGAIVGLAGALGVPTVAEGVETDAEDRAVRALGCEYGQGYFYGRPASIADAELALGRR